MPLVDFSAELTALDGKTLSDGGTLLTCECGAIMNKCPSCGKTRDIDIMTLKTVSINALLFVPRTAPNTAGMKGEEKIQRYELAKKIFSAGGPVDLTTENIGLIKKAIDQAYPGPLIVAQAGILLEGKPL